MKKISDGILFTLNSLGVRAVLGIIIACLIATPYINQYDPRPAYLVGGILFAVIVLASMIWQFTFQPKHIPFVLVFLALTIAWVVYILRTWV